MFPEVIVEVLRLFVASIPKIITVHKCLPTYLGKLVADHRGSLCLVVVEFRIFRRMVGGSLMTSSSDEMQEPERLVPVGRSQAKPG